MIKNQEPNKCEIRSTKSQTARGQRISNFLIGPLNLFVIWFLVLGHSAPARGEDFFTIVVMPDTQYYTEVQWKTDQYFNAQTQWIVDHRADEHIAFVSHVGDLQQDGTFLRTDDH